MLKQKILRILKICFWESYSWISGNIEKQKEFYDGWIYKWKRDIRCFSNVQGSYRVYIKGGEKFLRIKQNKDVYILDFVIRNIETREIIQNEYYYPISKTDNLVLLITLLKLMECLKDEKKFKEEPFFEAIYFLDKNFKIFQLEKFLKE